MSELDRLSNRAAISVVLMAAKKGDAHLSSSLSCIDACIGTYAYFREKGTLSNPDFILSKGHAAPALYAVMAEFNAISKKELNTFNSSNSRLGIHPSRKLLSSIRLSTGSLGHGLSFAAGIAHAKKLRGKSGLVVCITGDGELNEGSIWEGCSFASNQKLGNLVVLVDHNKIQSIARYSDISGAQSIVNKFKAFGWESKMVNGHDPQTIYEELMIFEESMGKNKPIALVLDTISGFRVSFMQDSVLWHYKKPNQSELEIALNELKAYEIGQDLIDIFK